MLTSQLEEHLWRLATEDGVLLEHSAERPFATAVRREKTYTASRGTVKTAVREAERIPLDSVHADGEGAVLLSGGEQTLRVAFAPCDGGAELVFPRRWRTTCARCSRRSCSSRATAARPRRSSCAARTASARRSPSAGR